MLNVGTQKQKESCRRSENDTANPNKTNVPSQDNVLRGKVICSCCGGKMQRRKGSSNAGWHFFTCISNNRIGAGHCTGMYIRESDIMNAIFREIKAFVQNNNNATPTYKNEIASLATKAKQLDREINQLMETSKSRYEDFIMEIAGKDDLQKCRNDHDALQIELQDINSQIEVLGRMSQHYQLFHNALNDKEKIGQLMPNYLQKVTVSAGGQIDVQLMH